MLGNFLEFGLSSQAVGEALQFYRSIGFQSVTVGDLQSHPYAVVSDGAICVGLHEWELEEPRLTFVRPDLEHYLRALRRRRVEVEFARLAPDEFNELGFRDSNGQLVTLLEARTFSPGSLPDHDPSLCGSFLEFSRATHSIADSRSFWGELGFESIAEGDQPHPWVRMRGRGLTLGFHEVSTFASALTFEADDLTARAQFMKAKGVNLRSGSPLTASHTESATLLAPEGCTLYLVEAPSTVASA